MKIPCERVIRTGTGSSRGSKDRPSAWPESSCCNTGSSPWLLFLLQAFACEPASVHPSAVCISHTRGHNPYKSWSRLFVRKVPSPVLDCPWRPDDRQDRLI